MPVLRQSVGFIISWLTVLGKYYCICNAYVLLMCISSAFMCLAFFSIGTTLPAMVLFLLGSCIYIKKKPARPHCRCHSRTSQEETTSVDDFQNDSEEEKRPLLGQGTARTAAAAGDSSSRSPVVLTPQLSWRERAKQLIPFLGLFSPLVVYWAIFYQQNSTWIVQGRHMNCYVGRLHVPPGMQRKLYSCDCIGINHPLPAKLEFSARAKVVDSTYNPKMKT